MADYTPIKGYWQANAIESAPDLSTLSSEGYPSNGDKTAGMNATVPGAAWFYWVDQSIRAVIAAAGKTSTVPPSPAEFRDALKSLGWITDKSIPASKLAASLAFTGTPTAPTASKGTSTTQLATTAFVATAVAAKTFPVDTAMSTTSTNAVQNKVITAALNTTGYQVGDLRLYAGSDVPDGWFRCDGSTIANMSKNYPKLYAILGTNVLPNYTGRYPVGSSSQINGLIDAGLPNITGKFTAYEFCGYHNSQYYTEGALYVTGEYKYAGSQNHSGYSAMLALDASRSSEIYGKSTSVTPPSVRCAVLIKHD